MRDFFGIGSGIRVDIQSYLILKVVMKNLLAQHINRSYTAQHRSWQDAVTMLGPT